ncbi:APOBEC1 complementation factor-like [Triticum dicoccoides]|uniref:APOBEC1 complementation factor-like n=1 Tax=Triticum dicoccoides TaxID=85692 RepID=UPI001891D8AF|nr:APOBEC1 complementation factor-like [Triticum dicoccoides]
MPSKRRRIAKRWFWRILLVNGRIQPRSKKKRIMLGWRRMSRWLIMSEMAKNRHLKKEDIRKVLGQVGDVVEVRLHKDLSTNKNKAFAFVRFANKQQINGKQCCVGASEDNDTLFLGNICNTWTEEAIKKRLNEYGIQGVESLTLVPDTQNEGKNRGFAFLEFSCHGDAMIAFERLQEPDVVFGHPERTAKVAFAEPIKETDAEVLYKAKSVFIDGLPPYWDEDRVKDRFKAYGLLGVVLACDMSSVKRNGFGFLYFSTHEEALACITSMWYSFGGHFGEKLYFSTEGWPRVKRPHSQMEPDPGCFEPGPRCVCPRFDYYEPPFYRGN